MRLRRLVPRAVVVVAVGVVSVVVPIGPAAANVNVSTSMTVPVATAVGQTGIAASFTVINANTVPNQAESNTITQLRLAPSCASAPATGNPCPTPDPGVFALAPTATGAAGTACAGVNFTVSAPDASGIVTFTPVSPVVLSPPGGAPGSDRCTVNFTYSVLKVPTIDVNAGSVGVQTWTNLRAQVQSTSGLVAASHPSVQVTVARAQPQMTTTASPPVPLGAAIFDTATVTGVPGVAAPTGTVTFQVFGPNNVGCTGTSLATSTKALVGGTAQSDPFVPTQPGVYRFVATYNGDANYNVFASGCNAPGEATEVFPRRPVADFDGDGRTDLAVFRPSTGTWFVSQSSGGQTASPFGVSTDIPVPADYDGDRKVDVAVYRPSVGVWFIRRSSGGDQARSFGAPGDIPVPGDYDGDRLDDLAVYRPSSGYWFIRTALGADLFVPFGLSTDVPVPGDYDGDGKTDVAVYRPSSGGWLVRRSTGGETFAAWGTSTDIPVPADYDGDARTDFAVYRPASGTWFVLRSSGGSTAQSWGVSTDIPAPGDYDGDGRADLAVFRPASGLWFIQRSSGGTTTAAWGTTGDVVVALPPAIRMRYTGP